MTRTLEQHFDVLRMVGRDDVVTYIGRMAPEDQPLAAALAVREFAPARNAILSASNEELTSVAGRLLAEAVAR